MPGPGRQFKKYLRPAPIPECYAEPQALAARTARAAVEWHSLSQCSSYPLASALSAFVPRLSITCVAATVCKLTLRAGTSFHVKQARKVPVE